MSNNYRYRRRRSRMPAKYRRMIFFGACALVLVGLVILLVCLIGGKDDPNSPKIQPVNTETSAPATNAPVVNDPFSDVGSEGNSFDPEPGEDVQSPIDPEPGEDAQEPIDPEPADDIPDVDIDSINVVTPAPNKGTSTNGLRSVHFRIIGDVMFHDEQLKMAKKKNGEYDFDTQFKFIAESLAAADYTIANLETTVGKYKDMNYSGYPQFNSPESVMQTLKDCGIDFVTLANNHMLDRWFDGMKHDVDLAEKYDFGHVGAYRSKEERNTPVIYEIGGIKFGFVAYTHSTNTLERSSDKAVFEYGVPYLYDSDIAGDIKKLREAGAEVVIALPHWGTENTHIPDDTQKSYAKKLAKAGADIIIGSHSHMVEPMQIVNGKDANGNDRQVFIIYSMGNFISSMTMKRTDNGIILDLTVREQPDGSFRVEDVGYVPIYVWKEGGKYAVIPIPPYLKNKPSAMSDSQYQRMKESYREIVDVLGTDNFNVLSQ